MTGRNTRYGNKYNAQKVTLGSITFDSKSEERRYWNLKNNPDVVNIEVHPPFVLQERFKKCPKCAVVWDDSDLANCPLCKRKLVSYPAMRYVADFRVHYNDGRVEIEDVKGVQTPEFKLKKKLFERKYPELELKIVYVNGVSKRKSDIVEA